LEELLIESVGVNFLDRRRIDVAVDLTPCTQAVEVELVILGPQDDELSSVLLVQNRTWMLDKIIHLRQDAVPGEYVLHVGVFHENELVTRAARRFFFVQRASE
jgi:hypothetical protein